VAAFQAEANTGNSGFAFAIEALKKDFIDPKQDGPIRAAEFHPGNAKHRDHIREEMATGTRFPESPPSSNTEALRCAEPNRL
jgi:hypothetical protein